MITMISEEKHAIFGDNLIQEYFNLRFTLETLIFLKDFHLFLSL